MSQDHPRLLVVDDEVDICELIADVAEEVGFQASMIHDGDEFQARFREFCPTVIFLDLKLPGHDGIELIRFLAENKCTARIILGSGADDRTLSTAARIARSHGLDVILTVRKPLDIEALEQVLAANAPSEPKVDASDLATAIEEGQITAFYQPKIDLSALPDWKIVGAEALARWEHPTHGRLAPNLFIPLAQSSGLMGKLTRRVLDTALRDARRWADMGHPTPVAVNLDPSLLADLGLPDRIADILRGYGLPPHVLTLEVTESGAMADADLTMEILTRFRIKDIDLSIDDFGTGYSSLVQLYRMPFNELKIDRSFVFDVGDSREARIIVDLLIDLGKKLGLKLCAEGVETSEALDRLHDFGCDLAQGYHFSAPVPAAEFESLIVDWSAAGHATKRNCA